VKTHRWAHMGERAVRELAHNKTVSQQMAGKAGGSDSDSRAAVQQGAAANSSSPRSPKVNPPAAHRGGGGGGGETQKCSVIEHITRLISKKWRGEKRQVIQRNITSDDRCFLFVY